MKISPRGAVIEAGLVLALFLILRIQLKETEFADWQVTALGSAILSSAILFFVLPMIVMIATRRNPGNSGLTTENLRYHASVGWQAARFLLPSMMLFPLLAVLGTTHEDWLGATVLTVGFGATSCGCREADPEREKRAGSGCHPSNLAHLSRPARCRCRPLRSGDTHLHDPDPGPAPRDIRGIPGGFFLSRLPPVLTQRCLRPALHFHEG